MRTLWVCDGCDTYEPCYVINDSAATPCKVCRGCEWKRIEGITNIKLTYDVITLKHKEVE